MAVGATELITGILGGGLVLLIPVVTKAIRDWRQGKTLREDTAIRRWKELVERTEADERRAWKIVVAYRNEYTRIWTAYVAATGDKDTFPIDPTIERDLPPPSD